MLWLHPVLPLLVAGRPSTTARRLEALAGGAARLAAEVDDIKDVTVWELASAADAPPCGAQSLVHANAPWERARNGGRELGGSGREGAARWRRWRRRRGGGNTTLHRMQALVDAQSRLRAQRAHG